MLQKVLLCLLQWLSLVVKVTFADFGRMFKIILSKLNHVLTLTCSCLKTDRATFAYARKHNTYLTKPT